MDKISKAVWACLLMALASAVLMFGHEVVRSASSSLVKQAYGVENLPLVMAFLPLVLFPSLFLYNRTLSYFGPKQTIVILSIISGVVILFCYVGIRLGYPLASGFLFLWREAYIVLIVEQMWSFVNSVLTEDEAKKTNGMILFISTVGALLGGMFVNQMAMLWGTTNLVVVGALVCFPCAAICHWSYSWIPQGDQPKAPPKKAEIDWLGFGLLRQEKVLGLLFVIIAASQVYATVVTLNFETQLTKFYPEMDKQTSVSGAYFALLSGLALFFQSVVSPIVLSLIPVSFVHIGVPLVHMMLIMASLFIPGFGPVAATFLVFKCLDFSIFRSAKEILYMPLSFDARYRAKGLIDVLGYRLSKGGTTIIILLGGQLGLVFTQSSYCLMGASALICWIACVGSLWAGKMLLGKQARANS